MTALHRTKDTAAHNMALTKAGVQSELQPFALLINFGAVREVKCF
jgi:hypothetical protein